MAEHTMSSLRGRGIGKKPRNIFRCGTGTVSYVVGLTCTTFNDKSTAAFHGSACYTNLNGETSGLHSPQPLHGYL